MMFIPIKKDNVSYKYFPVGCKEFEDLIEYLMRMNFMEQVVHKDDVKLSAVPSHVEVVGFIHMSV